MVWPAGPAGAPLPPLLPLLWCFIRSCSLPCVIYYFIFGLICYFINHSIFYHWWWVVVGGGGRWVVGGCRLWWWWVVVGGGRRWWVVVGGGGKPPGGYGRPVPTHRSWVCLLNLVLLLTAPPGPHKATLVWGMMLASDPKQI